MWTVINYIIDKKEKSELGFYQKIKYVLNMSRS